MMMSIVCVALLKVPFQLYLLQYMNTPPEDANLPVSVTLAFSKSVARLQNYLPKMTPGTLCSNKEERCFFRMVLWSPAELLLRPSGKSDLWIFMSKQQT